MKLYPALRIKGRVYIGKLGDHHDDVGESIGMPHPDESLRGFSPDGVKFLSRKQGLEFMQRHDPKGYRALPKAAYKELHSEHLATVYGFDAKAEAPPAKPSDLKKLTALVYDRGGLHTFVAEKLAEKFGKVMYFLADSDAYPSSQKAAIGSGLPGVKRVHDFFKHVDEADLIMFPDIYDGELQHWLRSKGYTVFGSGRGEQIEVDKILFLKTLEQLGLCCPKTYLAEGMDDLVDYLKRNDGETMWLKNLHRGDFETKKFSSMAQIKPFLDDLRKRVGTASDTMEVLVQHKVDSACESGIDTYCVDGEYPDICVLAYEDKDKCAVAKVYDTPPESLHEINKAFGPTFKKLGYRGNYSTEIRITEKGEHYYIDATCRMPSPPGELLVEIYENWAEAVWDIANGRLPELKAKAKYGVEVILTSDWHSEHELHVAFPKKYAQNVKLKNHAMRDGEHYCVPNQNGGFFGAIVAWGETLDDAISQVEKIAEEFHADDFSFDPNTFNDAKAAAEKGAQFGIKF